MSDPLLGSATENGRRSDIQGLRAVAVLMVVTFHAGLPVPGGFVGVDVFFVISGFVITLMLQRQRARDRRISFSRFYLRRFKRLTPALALMISVTLVASVFILSPLGPQQTVGKTALGAVLLVANVVIARTTGGYFDAPAETNPLLNTWSLSVEEQFYLAFPALLALGWIIAARWRRAARVPYLIVGVVALGSLALVAAGSYGLVPADGQFLMGFYSPFTRAWEFAAGALLALVLADRSIGSRSATTALGIVGAAMVVASCWLINASTPFPGKWTLLPVVGTVLLLAAGSGPMGWIGRLLILRPMVRIGDWSYSIYLWHWPLIVFAALLWPLLWYAPLVAALASFPIAIASYHWVEQPLRHLTVHTRRRALTTAGVVVATPAILAVATWALSTSAYGSEKVQRSLEATELHIGQIQGCRSHFIGGFSAGCSFNTGSSGEPIYVLGDSNADHFSEGLIDTSERLERPVYFSNGCVFVDVLVSNPALASTYGTDCRANTRNLLRWLRSAPRGTVIIANSDHYWTDNDGKLGYSGWEVGLTEDSMSTDPEKRIEAFKTALSETVRSVKSGGHEVYLVQTIPHFEEPSRLFSPATCSLYLVLTDDCWPSTAVGVIDQVQGPPRAVLSAVASQEGVGLIDFRSSLCPDGLCSTKQGEVPAYLDGHHLSVAASEALAGRWTQLLSRRQ